MVLYMSTPEQQLLNLRLASRCPISSRSTCLNRSHSRIAQPIWAHQQRLPEYHFGPFVPQPHSARRSTQIPAFWHRKAHTAVSSVPISSQAGMLHSLGLVLLGGALLALCLAGILALLEFRRTNKELQSLLQTLEKEIPDTASTMRLSGMEMTDCIEEISLLSADLTNGVRASAKMLQDAEQGLREGSAFVNSTATKVLLPAVRTRIPAARRVMEDKLTQRAKLLHTEPTLLQMAQATKVMVRRVRIALAAADIYNRGMVLVRGVDSRLRSRKRRLNAY